MSSQTKTVSEQSHGKPWSIETKAPLTIRDYAVPEAPANPVTAVLATGNFLVAETAVAQGTPSPSLRAAKTARTKNNHDSKSSERRGSRPEKPKRADPHPPPPTHLPLIHPAFQAFDDLPDSAFISLPVVCALFGCSPATVWRRVRSGQLVAPHRIGVRSTRWQVGELRRHLGQLLTVGGAQ